MTRAATRQRVSAIAHGIAVAAVLFAMSPWGREAAVRPRVVIAFDVSASVLESGADPALSADGFAALFRDAPPQTMIDVLAFATTARLWTSGTTPAAFAAALRRAPPALDPWATRPAAAIASAAARGSGGPVTVVLVTDGDGIDGAALAAARGLRVAGSTLHVVPGTRPSPSDRAFIAAVEAPLRIAPGAPATLEIAIARHTASRAPVSVVATERGGESRRTAITIGPGGRTTVALTFPGRRAISLRSFDIALGSVPADPARRATVDIAIGDPVRVGSLGPPPAWLTRLGDGFAVRRVEDPAAAIDVLVVAGLAVGPAPLDGAAASRVAAAVRRGVGLLAVAGSTGFGPGGWRGSALELTLPVRIERPGPDSDVSFVLDRSGSMTAGDRWLTAARATVSVLAALGERDRVNIVTFAGAADEALAWRPVAGAAPAALAALRAVRPGGPTNLAAALDAVSFPEPAADSHRRLLIVLSDGRLPEAESRYRAVGVALRERGVRVAAVQSAGSEPAPGLRALTLDGANGHVVVVGRDDLATAFRAAASDGWWLDDPGAPQVIAQPPVAPATGWPAPGRVSRTRLAKTGTAVAAIGATGEVPVLAIGSHGLGRVAVAAIDPVGSAWTGGGPWRSILHWLSGGADLRRPAGRVVIERNRGRVTLRLPPGVPRRGWRVRWGERTARLDPVGPGRLRGELEPPAAEPLPAAWATPEGASAPRVPLPVIAVPGVELAARSVDRAALTRLAEAGGGRLLDRAQPIPIEPGRGGRPGWPWIALALIAFLCGRVVKFASASGR